MSTSPKMKMDKRTLFGTDGIRGMAGHFPLDSRTIRVIGRALGRYIASNNASKHAMPRVALGEDTRESSRWIAESLAAGLADETIGAASAGVITTPGVAFLARTEDFAAGIVISASHNPWTDNGIKVFGHDGYKLPDSAELEIERIIFSLLDQNGNGDGAQISPLHPKTDLHNHYVQWLAEHWPASNGSQLKLVVDCANGAASAIAPEVFTACGIHAKFIHSQPDGKNINENCGALHPEVVAKEVSASGANAGVTFDGDADRCLFADAQGNVINGDGILLLVARYLQLRNQLPGNIVVATTMSNMGLEAALRRSGIKLLRSAVGDKYVLQEMHKSAAVLGGEQSGHIIFRDGEATTGDGLLTALRVLQIVAESGKPIAELVADLKIFPQTIKNVRVREKKPLEQISEVARAIRAAEEDLNGNGRVVVRYSGTEALARVMVEAESEEKMQRHVDTIAAAIKKSLGA